MSLASSRPYERGWLALLCLLASLRVLVYAAAFPFFNNVDEQLHYDMVVRYAHGQVGRQLGGLRSDSARVIARYGSPEYFYPPTDYPGGVYPPLPWTLSEPMQANLARGWEKAVNVEAHAPPLYYAVTGAWLRLAQALGAGETAQLYGIRLLNVPLIAALVWLAFATARAVFPEHGFMRLAVPTLVAFLPQDAFYSIQSDVLSPLCFGIAFLGLLRIWQADVPSRSWGALTGLALACAGLAKVSNFPLVALGGIALLFDGWRRQRCGTLRAAAPALGLAAALAALPILASLTWNALVFGDFTGSGSKLALLDWTPKPLREWLPHPLFTPNGAGFFWTGLVASFWRGELVWHGQPLALPAADAFYVLSSTLLPALGLLGSLRAGSALPAQRRALFLAAASFLLPVAFLAVLSLGFDFGGSPYPTREHPYFMSGRLLSGALIPFALLYAYGLDRAFAWTERAWPRFAALAGIAALVTLSEAIANRAVFSSQYNWFALLR